MFSKEWRQNNRALINQNPHRINANLDKAPNINAFLEKYQPAAKNDEVGKVAANPAPDVVRSDVGDEGEDYGLEGPDRHPRQRVDKEEEWADKLQREDLHDTGDGGEADEGGEDSEDGNGNGNGGPMDEELDPRRVQDLQAQASLARAASIEIDPALYQANNEAHALAPPPPKPAQKPTKPKPRPKQRLPPADNPLPEPQSTIHIQVPLPPTGNIPPLPKPWPTNAASSTPAEEDEEAINAEIAEIEAARAEAARAETNAQAEAAAHQMPLDGPQYPPPPLKRQREPEPEPEPEPDAAPPPKRQTRRQNKAADAGTEPGAAGPSGELGAGGAPAQPRRGRKAKEPKEPKTRKKKKNYPEREHCWTGFNVAMFLFIFVFVFVFAFAFAFAV
ncbi:hypothetical protein FRC09_014664 [Ceratobasidium sp. 395]|nr:hypothetical protein FRC09_014664 [Ceratobasidium sp. 395]